MNIGRDMLRALGAKLPITERPFDRAARRLGICEREFLSLLRAARKAGLIRRYGALLDHRKLGPAANALVAWRAEGSRLRHAARVFAEFPDVSHCYERATRPRWPYALYTMVHARSGRELRSRVTRMAREAGLTEYRMMPTVRELKKSSLDPAALYRSRSIRERAISRRGSARRPKGSSARTASST